MIFLGWESYIGDDAMVPFSIVRRRVVWSSCLVIAFFFGGLLLLPPYLFSSCERVVALDEWSVCPTRHTQPNGDGSAIRGPWYKPSTSIP